MLDIYVLEGECDEKLCFSIDEGKQDIKNEQHQKKLFEVHSGAAQILCFKKRQLI